MKRTLTFAATLLAFATFAVPNPAHARVAAATPRCVIPYIYGTSTCFAPSQVAVAERLAPFGNRPAAVVTRVTGLPLRQAGIWTMGTGAHRSVRLDYIFGAIPRNGDFGRAPAHPTSIWLREDQGSTGTANFTRKYEQRACGVTMEISQAALNHPYRAYGPWFLIVGMPHRNATLSIVANRDQSTLKRLACAVLAAR